MAQKLTKWINNRAVSVLENDLHHFCVCDALLTYFPPVKESGPPRDV